MSFDFLGALDADEIGAGSEYVKAAGGILEGLSGVAKSGIDIAEQKKAADEAAADSAAKLDAAKRADIAAAEARANAEKSKALKNDAVTIKTNEELASNAEEAQKEAAGKLTGNDANLRAQAAETAKQRAFDAWKKAPNDVYAKAYYEAWKKIATKGNFTAIDKKSTESVETATSGESFLVAPIAGTPVRPWHIGVGVVLGGLAYKFIPRALGK